MLSYLLHLDHMIHKRIDLRNKTKNTCPEYWLLNETKGKYYQALLHVCSNAKWTEKKAQTFANLNVGYVLAWLALIVLLAWLFV